MPVSLPPAFLGFLSAVPILISVWLLVTALLSTLSGWPRLAERFPGGAPPPGNRVRGQVLGLGPIRENNVTTLIPTDPGLYMCAMPLFWLRRPSILLPWTQIRYLDRPQVLWSTSHVLNLGGLTTMRVRPALLPLLRSHGVHIPSDALT
jgi:hypothetical protein